MWQSQQWSFCFSVLSLHFETGAVSLRHTVRPDLTPEHPDLRFQESSFWSTISLLPDASMFAIVVGITVQTHTQRATHHSSLRVVHSTSGAIIIPEQVAALDQDAYHIA